MREIARCHIRRERVQPWRMIERLFRKANDLEAEDGEHDVIAPGRIPATARLLPAAALALLRRADRSAGAPLPADVRGRFERSLGADLSSVRVHTGADSAAAARAVRAHAYTIGSDIHFAAGTYAPGDPFGLHLLAHEVAHTQQQSGGAKAAQAKLEVSAPGDAAEAEADRAADAMLAGHAFAVAHAPIALARAEDATAPAGDDHQDLTALRKQLLAQFDEFNGKVVGDKAFDSVETKKAWDATKGAEAIQKAASVLTGGQIQPPAIFTTCIQTQGVMMVKAFAACKLKPIDGHFDFAHQMKDNPDAWHAASAGMGGRPKPGDILVFAARGGSIDRAEQNQRYAEGQTADAQKKEDQAQGKVADAQASVAAAKQALDDLQAAEADAKTSKAQRAALIMRATSALNLATANLANWSAMEKNTSKNLGAAQDVEKKMDAKTDEARQTPHDARLFEFRHTCFLAGAITKTDDGKEQWPVFGGGATLTDEKGEAHQGAEKAGLIYDPGRNELTDPSGKAGAVWLQGWVDVDKMGTAAPAK